MPRKGLKRVLKEMGEILKDVDALLRWVNERLGRVAYCLRVDEEEGVIQLFTKPPWMPHRVKSSNGKSSALDFHLLLEEPESLSEDEGARALELGMEALKGREGERDYWRLVVKEGVLRLVEKKFSHWIKALKILSRYAELMNKEFGSGVRVDEFYGRFYLEAPLKKGVVFKVFLRGVRALGKYAEAAYEEALAGVIHVTGGVIVNPEYYRDIYCLKGPGPKEPDLLEA